MTTRRSDRTHPGWIVVSFDGTRDIRYGHRGRRELGPLKPIATIAIPWEDVEKQIEGAGFRIVPAGPP